MHHTWAGLYGAEPWKDWEGKSRHGTFVPRELWRNRINHPREKALEGTGQDKLIRVDTENWQLTQLTDVSYWLKWCFAI